MPEHHIAGLDLRDAHHRLLKLQVRVRQGGWRGTDKNVAMAVYPWKLCVGNICTVACMTVRCREIASANGRQTVCPMGGVIHVRDCVGRRFEERPQDDVRVGEQHVWEDPQCPLPRRSLAERQPALVRPEHARLREGSQSDLFLALGQSGVFLLLH